MTTTYQREVAKATRRGSSVAAVVWDGERLWGDVDAGHSTVREIGSVTKTFTGTLTALAVTAAELDLHGPIAAAFESASIKHKLDGITYAHLATHTSGLPRLPRNLLKGADPRNPYAHYGEAELLVFLDSYRPRRAPGKRVAYSNLGTGLLGYLLERHLARSWYDLVRERIAAPAGMGWIGNSEPVQGHSPRGRPAAAWDMKVLAGAGALRMSAGDLGRYLRWLMAPERAAVREVLASVIYPAGKDRAVVGWFLRDVGGREVWWHNGGTAGHCSFAAFVPSASLAVALLIDRGPSLLQQVFDRLPSDRLGWALLVDVASDAAAVLADGFAPIE